MNGATVLSATSKDEIKASLGRSPDHLDAVAMAVWARETEDARDGYARRAENVVVL